VKWFVRLLASITVHTSAAAAPRTGARRHVGRSTTAIASDSISPGQPGATYRGWSIM
jgi:hypothetical protein